MVTASNTCKKERGNEKTRMEWEQHLSGKDAVTPMPTWHTHMDMWYFSCNPHDSPGEKNVTECTASWHFDGAFILCPFKEKKATSFIADPRVLGKGKMHEARVPTPGWKGSSPRSHYTGHKQPSLPSWSLLRRGLCGLGQARVYQGRNTVI